MPLSGRPRAYLSSQFPITISKGGLTFLPPLKPFLLRKWHVWLLELTTFVAEDGINFFLYIPHDMLSPSSRLVTPAGIEPTFRGWKPRVLTSRLWGHSSHCWTRTSGPLINSQMLPPTELSGNNCVSSFYNEVSASNTFSIGNFYRLCSRSMLS